MSVDETVLQLAALKALGDHVKEISDKTKAALTAQLRRGTITAFVGDEDSSVDAGTVVVVPTRYGWSVIDPVAFLAWVKVHRPTAIVESVRSSDQQSILEGIEKAAAAGEEVPDGVARTSSAGYVSVKQTAAQRDALLEAAADGRLPAMPITLHQVEGG